MGGGRRAARMEERGGGEEGKVGNRKSKGIPKRAKSASGARVNSATRAGVGVPLRGLCIYLLCLSA